AQHSIIGPQGDEYFIIIIENNTDSNLLMRAFFLFGFVGNLLGFHGFVGHAVFSKRTYLTIGTGWRTNEGTQLHNGLVEVTGAFVGDQLVSIFLDGVFSLGLANVLFQPVVAAQHANDV